MTPAGLSSNTRHLAGSAGGWSLKRRAHTWKMSGAGLPAMTSGSSEPFTTCPNRPNSCLCACVLRRKVCRGLEVATAKGTPCDTRWRISQQSKRNRSKYNLNTSYFKINARYEVCVDSLHGLLIEQFELPESRKKISRKKKNYNTLCRQKDSCTVQ